MAAVERKPLTVHYRRMADPTGALRGQTLERWVREALVQEFDGGAISGHWKRRAWLVPPGDTDTYLMNVYHDDGESFFGDLTVYTKGFMQALLKDEPDAAMLAVEQQPPPEGREYIHSMMYWMVIGNHVLIIQSRSLATKQLEEYLSWLLKDRSKVLPENTHVLLNAKFDMDEVGGDIEDLREIIVGGVGVLEALPENRNTREIVTEVDQHVGVDDQRSWGERAVGVLRAIMTSEADVQKLLKSIPDEADLNVSVHIGYKAKKRKVSRAPMQQVLRNLPDGEITAVGKTGRQTGKDVRLSLPVRIRCDGSLPDPIDVQEKLKSAYRHFVENGKIEP
ncbi:MAG: hypothetical protein QM645_11330 [Asticcacaulis sp.]